MKRVINGGGTFNIIDMDGSHVIVSTVLSTGRNYSASLSYVQFVEFLYPYTLLLYEFVKPRILEGHRSIIENKLHEYNAEIDKQLNHWKDP